MKIDAYGNIKGSSPTKKKTGVYSSGNFSTLLDVAEAEGSPQTNASKNVLPPPSLSGILELQEVPGENIRRKKIIKQGGEMLDSLEQLRRRLLLGTLPMEILYNLNQQLAIQKQKIADPYLMAIIADIELRTAVELAKLEIAIANNAKIN